MSPGEAAPLITVIVPTRNSGACIGRALASLAAQRWRGFEVVVCDGASDDDTMAQVQAAAARLPSLRSDSRVDAGVYDAINRGIGMARGDWVLVLGSDDTLHADDVLERAAEALRTARVDVVYGDVRMMAANHDGVAAGERYPGPTPLERLLVRNVCQQSIFYRRSLFETFGGFDQRYRLWADWDFNLRVAFDRPWQWIDLVVADYAATGMSADGRGDAAFDQDAPGLLRRELLARAHQRELWPLQRRLLRQADAMRRRGRWGEAMRQLGAWALLRARRWTAGASSNG